MFTEEYKDNYFINEKQDDKDIRCPGCNFYFSEKNKPYILPCFHNICDKCIDSLIEQKNTKCPICLKLFIFKETNQPQVNFGFLNLMTKILNNKIIFCKNCNKIYYWRDHHITCNQKYFEEIEQIFKEIKISCENGFKIINLINNFTNGKTSILNYYNDSIKYLLSELIKEIKTTNMNKLKNGLNKIYTEFKNNKKELNFKYIKSKIINFLALSAPFEEKFGNIHIKELVHKYSSPKLNNIDKKIYMKNNINKKLSKSPEIIRYKKKIQISPKDLNILKNNWSKGANNKLKNQIIVNTKIYNNIQINFNSNRTPYIAKKNIKMFVSEKKLNKNSDDKNISDDIINNFDDEYHDNEAEEKIDKNSGINKIDKYNKTFIKAKNKKNNFNDLKNIKIQNNKIINNNKNINPLLLEAKKENIKKNMGINAVKVISLTKKINNNLKIEKKSINDNNKKYQSKINKVLHISPHKNIILNEDKAREISYHNKIKGSPKYHLKINKEKMKLIHFNKISNINDLSRSFDGNKAKMKFKDIFKKKPIISKNCGDIIDIKKSKGNKNILHKNNSYDNLISSSNKIKSKNGIFTNNQMRSEDISLNKEKSMDKIISNFNKISEVVEDVKRYENIIDFIYNFIKDNVDRNLEYLKYNIFNNYKLLLKDLTNNFNNSQKRFLFSFKNNTKTLILFHLEYNSLLFLNLDKSLPNFPNFNSSMKFELVEKENETYNIIISGGINKSILGSNSYSMDSFIIIDISKFKYNEMINSTQIIENPDSFKISYKNKMPSAKSFHSLLYSNNNIYIIGGFDIDKKASNVCFYFSLSNKKWNHLPNLYIGRADSSICIYNKNVIYAIGGRNNETELNSIESLDLAENKKWNMINVIDNGYIWNGIYNSSSTVLEENKILIFGGEDKNKIHKESFLFDLETKNIYRGIDLKIPASFNGQGVHYNGKIIAIDFKNKNGEYENKIHVFDIKKNKWIISDIK